MFTNIDWQKAFDGYSGVLSAINANFVDPIKKINIQ